MNRISGRLRYKLQRGVQRIQKRLATSKGAILMYHRVAEVDLDPWSLCVSPENFAAQLQVLQRNAHPLSLREFVQAYQQNALPPRAVAITFDDGYADNLHFAKPLLEQYQIPATVFVTTGYVGQSRCFWWEELAQLLLTPPNLPEQLSLCIHGETYCWDLGAAANSISSACQSHHPDWKTAQQTRLGFYYAVWQQLLALSERDRQPLLAEIAEWAGATPLPEPLSLSQRELCTLAEADGIEIGAHTVTHPMLSAQPVSVQQDEIQRSKIMLEALLNRPVTSFAYPFGNCSAATVRLAESLGFDCACSTVADLVWDQSHRWQLPRFTVENWTAQEFSQQLARWFHD